MTFEFTPLDQLRPGTVAVVGIPWDEYSSFLRGPAKGPAQVRKVMYGGSANLCAESGEDLGAGNRFGWVEDLRLGRGDEVLGQIEAGIAELLERGVRVISVGGDHAITYPILRAYAERHEGLSILHLDAHPDLYEEFEGNRFSHACPFARIMEDGLVQRLVQVGIRTMTPHLREQVERFGVEVVEMKDFGVGMDLGLQGPVYLSVDLDALDPSCAPGVSHHEPGGLFVRDVLQLIEDLDAPLVGADVVELNPDRDVSDMTAMVAVKLVKEIAAQMLAGSSP
jgi:agmatinase